MMLRLLSRHWWILGLRGLLAVIFGILALVWPTATIRVVVILFGIYALIDGLFSLVSALASDERRGGWWLVLIEALVGVAAGVVALVWPQITALAILFLIAGWAILTGILELIAAFRLRKQVEGEWALGLAGVVSIILGLLLAFRPGSGLIAVVWFVGAYAILFGVLLIVLSFRLRSLRQRMA